ncbi:fibrinogen C domain-containing protein 1-like [Clytia hemisphaerica]|uniref:fibrinogen C domain-containing protein 1-like n=1 Tax=Clytia hemisphaerica TaxID=252671 RepID=UPI0034D43250
MTFRILFLVVLICYWCKCAKQTWNLIAVDKTFDDQPFYEVSLMDERQCFGQCVYNKKCLSFEAYQTAPRKVECRLFDFTHSTTLVEKVGAKLHSKVIYKNCLEYFRAGYIKNGVYKINLLGTLRDVYCFMEGEGGGWMAFQRRYDGSISFEDKGWVEYKDGFGDGSGEYWLGLEALHKLTSQQSYDLYVLAMDFTGRWESKRFAGFTIGPEEPEKYKFDYHSVYDGNQYSSLELFSNCKGMKFSTKLHDNDADARNCAIVYPGGWWYKVCHADLMNGKYSQTSVCDSPVARGVHWEAFTGHGQCLKESLLMIRPN